MKTLTGTGTLIRLILRRDRFLLPLWVVVLPLMPSIVAASLRELAPTEQSRQAFYATIVSNPSLTSTLGPVFGSSLGALTAWRSSLVFVFIALISALTVIRHTRAEEDAGRRELLASGVLGRHAPMAAALVVLWSANLVAGLVMTLALAGQDLPAAGSLAMGLSYGAGGMLFGAIAALAAQLTEGAGGARGIALGALGTAFLLRAAGDAGTWTWLSWASPIGWVQRMRPYAGERWWVLILIVGLLVAATVAAANLSARRDLGAGVLPARLGPADAAPALRSPLALAWRLHRATLLGWTIGFAVFGAVVGGAAQSIDQMVSSSPGMAEIFQRLGGASALKDAYIAATISLLALAATGYAIATALRIRAEEANLRAEPVLATAVSRTSWALSHLLFAALGPAIILAVFGVSIGLTAGGRPADVIGAALMYLPAIWLLAALTAAVIGLLPRWASGVAFGAWAACLFITLLGPILQLDQAVLDLSPFTHIPRLPGGELTILPPLVLVAVALVLAAAGLAGLRRRDILSGT